MDYCGKVKYIDNNRNNLQNELNHHNFPPIHLTETNKTNKLSSYINNNLNDSVDNNPFDTTSVGSTIEHSSPSLTSVNEPIDPPTINCHSNNLESFPFNFKDFIKSWQLTNYDNDFFNNVLPIIEAALSNKNRESSQTNTFSDYESSKATRSQFRTRICKFWLDGTCTRGDSCLWAHGTGDQRAVPDSRKTAICKRWLEGTCTHQYDPENCSFAHGSNDLKKISGRLFLCGAYFKGNCSKGKDCPYAHSIDQLSTNDKINNNYCFNAINPKITSKINTQSKNVNIIDKLKGFI